MNLPILRVIFPGAGPAACGADVLSYSSGSEYKPIYGQAIKW